MFTNFVKFVRPVNVRLVYIRSHACHYSFLGAGAPGATGC